MVTVPASQREAGLPEIEIDASKVARMAVLDVVVQPAFVAST